MKIACERVIVMNRLQPYAIIKLLQERPLRVFCRLCCLVAAFFYAIGFVAAQEATRGFDHHFVMRAHIFAGRTLAEYLAGVRLHVFRKFDFDGDGRISSADVELHRAQVAADARRRQQPAPFPAPLASAIRGMLEFDTNGDKAVELSEFDVGAERVFRASDIDGDGTISYSELEVVHLLQFEGPASAPKKLEEQAKVRAACVVPEASQAAKVVLLSSYETDALSTTTIGSQDVATRTGSVVIESGREPIYLVIVSSRPIIWRVSGAVGRIERLVLAGAFTGPTRSGETAVPLVGASGVAPEKVTFLNRIDCIRNFTEVPSIHAEIAAEAVRRILGRDPAVIAARYKVSEFRVPSGQARASDRGNHPVLAIRKDQDGKAKVVIENRTRDPDLAREFSHFYPGGIIAVDPATVVSSKPAERYEVPPKELGLIQLLDKGILSRNDRGDYLIHGKMRFPAELSGVHRVRFLLLRGVPMPDGDPGQSCVVVEETGVTIGSHIC
jgi:hypothetical protein